MSTQTETEVKKETSKVCVTCKWWLLDEEKKGWCHKSPPTRNLENTRCCFPPTDPMQWCGSWEIESEAGLKARKASLRPAEAIKQVEATQTTFDLSSIDLNGIL